MPDGFGLGGANLLAELAKIALAEINGVPLRLGDFLALRRLHILQVNAIRWASLDAKIAPDAGGRIKKKHAPETLVGLELR